MSANLVPSLRNPHGACSAAHHRSLGGTASVAAAGAPGAWPVHPPPAFPYHPSARPRDVQGSHRRSWLLSNFSPGALPQRPSGGPNAAVSTDLTVQRLNGADSLRAVLQLLDQQQHRSASSPLSVDIAGLRSLARLLQSPESSSHGSNSSSSSREGGSLLSADERISLQNCVRRSLLELHARRSLLSFQQAADTVASLCVVLPALGWPMPGPMPGPGVRVIPELAARLVPAATAADTLAPAPLPQLCGAFRSLGRLASAPKFRQLDPESRVMGEARAYLGSSMLRGERMEQADMATLAATVEIVVVYGLKAPEEFIHAFTGQVDRLVAAALRRDGASDSDDSDQGEAGGGRGPPSSRRRSTAATKAQGGADGGAADRDRRGRGRDRGRGEGSRGLGERGVPPEQRAAAPEPVGLDLTSLARLLTSWCCVEPDRPGPDPAWLLRTTALVLRTQDPDAERRAASLRHDQAALVAERDSLKEQLKDLILGNSAAGAELAGDLREAVQSMEPEAAKRALQLILAAREKLAQLRRAQEDLAILEAETLQGPLNDTELVTLLSAVAGRLGAGARTELGDLVERVLGLRFRALDRHLVVRALAALARMDHAPGWPLLKSALTKLQPELPQLSHDEATQLLASLEAFGYVPSKEAKARKVLAGLTAAAEARGGGLSGAPKELVRRLVRTHGSWMVAFPEDKLRTLQEVVERRVLVALPAAEVRGMSKRMQVLRASETASAGAGMSLPELLEDVLLPLARVRQGFNQPEMFILALGDWAARGFKDMDERAVADLLNVYAQSAAWPAVPQLRELLYDLLERALSLPPSKSTELAPLLLAASRALRVMTDKMQRPPDTPVLDATEPRVAVLVLPAVERLLRLSPTAQCIAAAAQGLFVELKWRGPSKAVEAGVAAAAHMAVDTQGSNSPGDEGPVDQQAGSSRTQDSQPPETPPGGVNGLGSGQVHGLASAQAQALLVRMLEAAASSLNACSLQGHSYLLAACAVMRYPPPGPWLQSLYTAMQKELALGDVKAELLVELLNGVSQVDRLLVEAGHAAAADGSSSDGGGEMEARAKLLVVMAEVMLKEPALGVLSSQPDVLALAGRRLAVLGLRPAPSWLAAYTATCGRLLGSMSLSGLAHTAEGLALLRAAPEPAFLEELLLQATKGLKNISTYDPYLYGLLLGGVHVLRQNGLQAAAATMRGRRSRRQRRQQGQGQDQGQALPDQPLSKVAMDAWARVHSQLVTETRKGTRVQSFQPHQLILVVSAVASYELTRPAAQSVKAVPGSGGQRGGSRASAAVPDLGRVSVEWLQDFVGALLYNLPSSAHQSASTLLPPPSMLVDLLRLTSYVLYGARDGAITELIQVEGEAGQPESVVKALVAKYVRRSMALLASHHSTPGTSAAVAMEKWLGLLRAAMAAGIRPEPPEVSAYVSTLAASIHNSLRGSAQGLPATGAAASEQEDEAVRAVKQRQQQQQLLFCDVWSDLESGLQEVLLPALPSTPEPRHWGNLQATLLAANSHSSAVLAAASWRQLGLLCSYGAQLGFDLLSAAWWRQLPGEVERRLALPPSSPSPEDSASDGLEDLTLAVASVCYGLMINGCDAPPAALVLLRQNLEAWAGVEASGSASMEPLPSLHLLWVARQGGFLADVPGSVWAAAYSSGRGPNRAASLQPQQLGQLVLLHADRLRPSSAGSLPVAWGLPGWFTASWFEALEAAFHRQEQQLQDGRGKAVEAAPAPPLQRPLEPIVAALAVCYCRPGGSDNSSSDSYDSTTYLVGRGLPALSSSLPLADVPAFLAALAVRGTPLPRLDVQALVARLAGPAAPKPAQASRGISSSGFGSGLNDAEPQLEQLAPVEAVRVATLLLSAAKDVAVVVPALSALMPRAVQDLVRQALVERLGRSVLAAGLAPAVSDALDPGPSATAASCAACVSAIAAASMVETLLQATSNGPRQADTDPAAPALLQPSAAQQLPLPRPAAAGAAAQVGLESLPPEDLAQLAKALIEASGQQPLPPQAAAVLLRLLSREAVVRLVPVTLLERALRHSLAGAGGASGLPMPDATYQLLFARLQSVMDFSGLLLSLRRCGAADVQMHRALLSLPARDIRDLSADGAMGLLRVMVDSGVRERLAVTRRPHLDTGTNEDKDKDKGGSRGVSIRNTKGAAGATRTVSSSVVPDQVASPLGAYAGLTVQLLKQLVLPGGDRSLNLRQLTEVMRLVATLLSRLEGLAGYNFWESMFQLRNSVPPFGPDIFNPSAREETVATLFEYLAAAHMLGGGYYNEFLHLQAQRREAARFLGGHTSFSPAWEADAEAGLQQAGKHSSLILTFGPLLLSGSTRLDLIHGGGMLLIREGLDGLLGDIEHVLRQLKQPQPPVGSAAAAAAGAAVAAAAGAAVAAVEGRGDALGRLLDQAATADVVEGLASLPPSPSRLSPRLLGLLYAVLFLDRRANEELVLEDVAFARDMLHVMYRVEVLSLAGRSEGWTPLEHLTAVLDALEPIVLVDRTKELVGDAFYTDRIQVALLLAAPLCRLLVEDDEPLPEGLIPTSDAAWLVSPFGASQESLMEGLYLPRLDERKAAMEAAVAAPNPDTVRGAEVLHFSQPAPELMGPARKAARERSLPMAPLYDVAAAIQIASWSCVQLPAALRPPPGRRHGMPGDAAGDAAREAYVRASLPWLAVARRLDRLLFCTDTRNELMAYLRASGVSATAFKGRMAATFGAIIFPDWWLMPSDEAQAAQKALSQARAEAAQAEAEAEAAQAEAEAAAATAAAAVPNWAAVLPGAMDMSKLMRVAVDGAELLRSSGGAIQGVGPPGINNHVMQLFRRFGRMDDDGDGGSRGGMAEQREEKEDKKHLKE